MTGITPAGAGIMLEKNPDQDLLGDHPRGCGDNLSQILYNT